MSDTRTSTRAEGAGGSAAAPRLAHAAPPPPSAARLLRGDLPGLEVSLVLVGVGGWTRIYTHTTERETQTHKSMVEQHRIGAAAAPDIVADLH